MTTAVLDAADPPHKQRRHRLLLPAVLTGQAMSAMDVSIVNVAAPAIQDDLGVSGASLQMVIAGYVLAYAVLLVMGARLGNDHGYRRLFLIGLAAFTAASLLCGLAPHSSLLIAARTIQGVGAALMVPQVLSLIQTQFEGAQRAQAVGYYSMILALGVAVGQLLGGVIVTFDVMGLGWRLAFLINVPVGLLLLASGRSVLPATRGPTKRQLDMAGAVALGLSMLLVIVPLTFGREVGWPAWTWVSLGGGAFGFVGFVVLEKAIARRGRSPLLDIEAIFAPGVKAGLFVIFISFACYGGLLFTLALHMQSGLGFSPLRSGLTFTAYAAGFAIANLRWSKLPPRLLRWTPSGGLAAMAVAAALFGLAALWHGWMPAVMLPLLFVVGSGHGFAFGPIVNQMATRVQPAQAPALSGLVMTTIQLAIVVGLATLGTTYLATATAGVPDTSSFAIAVVAFMITSAVVAAISCSIHLARVFAEADRAGTGGGDVLTTDAGPSAGEAATQVGPTTHALRRYERKGLLRPAGRHAANRRRYKQQDLDWLLLLTRLRRTGMPEGDMRRYAKMCRLGDETIAARRRLFEEHRDRVLAQLAELLKDLKALDREIELYGQMERD